MKRHDIGTRIKQRRNELGLKQLQIQEQTGISSGNLSDIENGKKLPSAPALLALSTVLDCSIDWMLKGESFGNEKAFVVSEKQHGLLSNDFNKLDMKSNMENIGKRIREKRKELHLTQNDIKSSCGISSGALSEIENGNRTPSIIIFHALSEVLNCSMDWLATGKTPNEQKGNIFVSEDINLKLESEFLTGFRQLDPDDQQELLDILEIILRKRNSSSSGVNRDAG